MTTRRATTIDEALRSAAAALTAAGIDDARLEARWLLAHALGKPHNAVLDRAAEFDPAHFNTLLARRLAREPLAFIVGHTGFWTLDLEVSPATLIPRADSETLIEAALDQFGATGPKRIVDLGTGTGCLLLAALVEFPGAFGIGVDLSPDAAALAARNARGNGLADRAAFLAGSWADALAGQFDLVLSNPPYIPARDIAGLMPEVARHEPARALDGGADGLDAYRAIIAELPRLLAPDGVAIFEIGVGQEADVVTIAGRFGLARVACRADLGGIGRALVLRSKKSFGSTEACR
jgi:release factor glutamine methyltransferase